MITCNILEKIEKSTESNLHIHIIQGLPKADKMELIIQKCTELGVNEFTPLQLKRCIVKIEKKEEEKKLKRWCSIAEVAAKQSGRDKIPVINQIKNIQDLSNILLGYDLVIAPYENEEHCYLKSILTSLHGSKLKIAIIIGTEGGFEETEINQLKDLGVVSISLGNRILRTETVALVLSSILMYNYGDLGGDTIGKG